jgi:hypothetical protein
MASTAARGPLAGTMSDNAGAEATATSEHACGAVVCASPTPRELGRQTLSASSTSITTTTRDTQILMSAAEV